MSSSCDAWPDTCTGELPPCSTSAPARCSESMMRVTLVSLPGIACAEITTTSSLLIFTCLCSCAAISDSALIGSPCDPVQMMHDLTRHVARDLVDVDHAADGDVEHAHLAAERDVVDHRAPEEDDLATGGDGGVGDLAHAVQVRREAGDDHPLVRVVAEHRPQRVADGRLRRREARAARVRRVGQEQLDAARALGDRAHERQVGLAAVDRGGVELEVAAVQDRAGGRVVRGGERVRHRVGDRDELAVERPDRAPLAVVHRDQLGALEHPRLLDAVAGQPERQR